jgi:ATPase subunit of ABC transporter with duplicated ATPase domains
MFEISDYLHLYGNDRVVIAGKNGSGKTTLLKILRESYE